MVILPYSFIVHPIKFDWHMNSEFNTAQRPSCRYNITEDREISQLIANVPFTSKLKSEVSWLYRFDNQIGKNQKGEAQFDLCMKKAEEEELGGDRDGYREYLKAFQNTKFNFEVNEAGQIFQLEGVDRLEKQMTDMYRVSNEGDRPFFNPNEFGYSEKYIRSLLELPLTFLPGKEIVAKGKWTRQETVELLDPVAISVEYFVDKVEGDTIFLKSRADIAMSVPLTTKESAIISGALNGQFKIDRHNGMVLEGVINVNIEGGANTVQPSKTSMKSTKTIKMSPVPYTLKGF